MARSREFVRHVLDLMAPLGAVRARAMFGGHGIYLAETMFAIVVRDRLYLKADGRTCPAFEARGLDAFTYMAGGKARTLRYYEAPAETLESADEMRGWALRGLQAALRSKRSGRPRGERAKKARHRS